MDVLSDDGYIPRRREMLRKRAGLRERDVAVSQLHQTTHIKSFLSCEVLRNVGTPGYKLAYSPI